MLLLSLTLLKEKMDSPKVPGVINFIVEVRCPHCQNINKFQPLTAVHGNIKTHLLKKSESPDFEGRCLICEKKFHIVKSVFI